MAGKFLIFTDLHLAADGREFCGREPRASFRRALAHALAAHGDAEFVALTGDLSDAGEAADYDWLTGELAGAGIPAWPIVGNHDDRGRFLAAFPGCGAEGFAQYAIDACGHRCLFLDTLDPGKGGGRLCAARLGWLERELAEAAAPVLVFLHHPPIPTLVPAMDAIGLAEPEPFRALMARHRDRVRHIFFGHCHMALTGDCGGVPASSILSTNHQFFPDFAQGSPIRPSPAPGAYGVAVLGPDWIACQSVAFDSDPR